MRVQRRFFQRGMVSIEWLLVFVGCVMPLVLFCYWLVETLATHFLVLSWTLLLPFP
jgi:hypothetical protein